MANTSANDWDEGSPAIGDARRNGATEINSLRKAVRLRLDKEHVASAGSGAGGEHREGSARVYYSATEPANKPDGVTPLDAADEGRLWIHPTTRVIKVFDGTDWQDTDISTSATIDYFYQENTDPNPETFASVSKSGLTQGRKYMVFVMGSLSGSASNDASYSLNVTVNSNSQTVTIDNHPDGTAPFQMAFVITVPVSGIIAVTAASNYYRIFSMIGFRVS